jgi:hypothetical protein
MHATVWAELTGTCGPDRIHINTSNFIIINLEASVASPNFTTNPKGVHILLILTKIQDRIEFL